MSRRRRAFVTLTLAGLASGTAHAASTVNPYAEVGYLHNSNLFALPSGTAGQQVLGVDPQRSDVILDYLAGVDGLLAWGQQSLTATLEGRRLAYQHYTRLDHNEYTFKTSLAWKLASLLEGTLGYHTEKRIAPFTQRISDQLTLETESTLGGEAFLHITEGWSLIGDLDIHTLNSPQPEIPNYGLRDHTEGLGVKYDPATNLDFRLLGSYTDGKYHGTVVVPDYNQRDISLVMNYRPSGISRFALTLGHSDRQADLAGLKASAITGSLAYHHDLTAKTGLNLTFDRSLNTFITGGDSEIDTGVHGSLTWAATYKTSLTLDYGYVRSTFDGNPIVNPTVIGREDHTNLGGGTLHYSPREWLSFDFYGQFQKRDSNIALFAYQGTMVGVKVHVRFGPPALGPAPAQ